MPDDRYRVEQADALAFLRGLADGSVDLVFTSPPYTDARDYGVKAARRTADWVKWLRPIVVEACRVSRGLAFFNVSDAVKGCVYGGGPEFLFADLTRVDGLVGVRPYCWQKSGPEWDDPGNGLLGSGGPYMHRNDWEPVYGYAEPGKLPPVWTDNTAFGKPPKYPAGGLPSHRNKKGVRKGVKIRHTNRGVDGIQQRKEYIPPAVSNPGNVIRALVGGWHMGSPLTHDNEAPMPLLVAERFVCWFCPPDGLVCDPFVGGGTTAHAAANHKRRFLGCDVRACQVAKTYERLALVTPDMFGAMAG